MLKQRIFLVAAVYEKKKNKTTIIMISFLALDAGFVMYTCVEQKRKYFFGNKLEPAAAAVRFIHSVRLLFARGVSTGRASVCVIIPLFE